MKLLYVWIFWFTSVYGKSSLEDILLDIHRRFLSNCGVYVVVDSSTESFDVNNFVKEMKSSVQVIKLLTTLNGRLTLPPNNLFFREFHCSSYVFITAQDEEMRFFITSQQFITNFDHLGKYVWASLSNNSEVADLFLSNDVMAWRQYAIVITSMQGLRGFNIWSHNMFEEKIEGSVHIIDAWINGRTLRTTDLFRDKLSNFQGKTLRAVTFEHAPSIIDAEASADEAVKIVNGHYYDGIDIRLLKILSKALNFDLQIYNPSDGGKWGGDMGNNTWSGLMGDISKRKGHMGVANLFIHEFHLSIVDMTVAYDKDFGCFVTPLPDPLPQWMALYFPFSDSVWILALLSIIFGPLVLFGIRKLNYLIGQKEVQWMDNIQLTIYYATAIVFGIGTPNLPKANITRSYYGMWIWFSLLLAIYYRSALTAFLTIPLTLPPIDTLSQLLSSNLPAWGATGMTFRHMLASSPDPLVQRLAEKYQPVSGAEEGIRLTAEGKYAMMENSQFLKYTIAQKFTNKFGKETMHVMKECFLPFRIGLSMPKGSPYKPNFDKVINRVTESGLVGKWFENILHMSENRGSQRESSEENYSTTLTTYNLQAAWLILGIGFGASLLAFLLEIVAGLKCTKCVN